MQQVHHALVILFGGEMGGRALSEGQRAGNYDEQEGQEAAQDWHVMAPTVRLEGDSFRAARDSWGG